MTNQDSKIDSPQTITTDTLANLTLKCIYKLLNDYNIKTIQDLHNTKSLLSLLNDDETAVFETIIRRGL